MTSLVAKGLLKDVKGYLKILQASFHKTSLEIGQQDIFRISLLTG